MAGVMTVGMKGIGRSIEAVRGLHGEMPGGALPEVRPLPESRPPLELRSFDEFGLKPKSNTDELGRITHLETSQGRIKIAYENPADPKMITQVEFPNGNISRTKDGINWRT